MVSLTLINADTDQDIANLVDGDTIDLNALATNNLNIRANTSPSTVGSVIFDLDGNSNYRTESAAPYALVGDSNGDYYVWNPSLGNHSLTATPYTSSGGKGTMGHFLTI
ncbi:MAG: hypothetical protein U5L96_21635 [Owenweeksia sp.]|nr:hypothetical protein [Owenweeksia sp.]